MLDCKVVGGTVVTASGRSRRDVAIAAGRIEGLYDAGGAPEARETIDAEGLLVFAGFVDAHFHCRAPARPDREDFTTGTASAAAGGVMTVLEMPIADPGVHSAAVVRERRALGERDAVVDFGLWGGGGAKDQADIRGMAAEGVIGFKAFLHAAPPGREREFLGLTAVDTPSLHRALAWIAETGLPCAMHCEDNALIEERIAELRAAGRTDPSAHHASRPPFVEAVAVAQVLVLARDTGASVHFPHISTGWAAELIAGAKAQGQPHSLETCPHYLLFDEESVGHLGPYAKINPPIRRADDRQAMLRAVQSGWIDLIGSDHAPYADAEKERGWTDIFAAPSGSPSVQTMAPALLDRALAGDWALEDVARLLGEAPARRFRLERKGRLAPGADADVVLFDPNGSWEIRLDDLFSTSRRSARIFEGRTLRGRVVRTLLRGETVYQDGRVTGRPGGARFVRPGVKQ